MAGWSEGYFTDIQYTRHFYAQMTPGFVAFTCLRQGVRPPPLGPGSVYMELGCGQGFGLALMAAANPDMAFFGVDFHPGQIANGQRVARLTGLGNLTLEELSFDQVLALPAHHFPKCDVIALHGVYSWISPENRAAIVAILERLLKPGGMVYISYNALPGWSALAPLQRFIREYVDRAPGPAEAEIVKAFQAAQALLDADAKAFRSVPGLREEIEGALRRPPAYLVHEHLNAHFHPLYHADVAQELAGAKLSFAASANLADDILRLAAPAALQPQIEAAQDGAWRQTLLDYAVNQRFRRDIFVRGRNAMGPAEREALLGPMRFMLLIPPETVKMEFAIPVGRMSGDPALYRPLVDALIEPRSFRELAQLTGVADPVLLQALTLLVGSGQAHPLAANDAPDRAAAAVRFNRQLAGGEVIESGPYYVAAGHAGTAVPVSLHELLALNAASANPADVRAAAVRGREIMGRSGSRLQVDGRTLSEPTEIEAELGRRIEAFNAGKLPLFRHLGVV